jgi:Sec-independent protein translocase protein TatA
MEQLLEFFKALLLISGCLILILLIISLIVAPIKLAIERRKVKKCLDGVADELDKIIEETIKEIEQEETKKVKNNKKPRKTKKTEKDVK